MRKRKAQRKWNFHVEDFDIAKAHFADGYTFAQIGSWTGVSRQRIHQRVERLKKALARA